MKSFLSYNLFKFGYKYTNNLSINNFFKRKYIIDAEVNGRKSSSKNSAESQNKENMSAGIPIVVKRQKKCRIAAL